MAAWTVPGSRRAHDNVGCFDHRDGWRADPQSQVFRCLVGDRCRENRRIANLDFDDGLDGALANFGDHAIELVTRTEVHAISSIKFNKFGSARPRARDPRAALFPRTYNA